MTDTRENPPSAAVRVGVSDTVALVLGLARDFVVGPLPPDWDELREHQQMEYLQSLKTGLEIGQERATLIDKQYAFLIRETENLRSIDEAVKVRALHLLGLY